MNTTNKGCLTFILVVAVIILLGAAFSVDGHPTLLDNQLGISAGLHCPGEFQQILELNKLRADIDGIRFHFSPPRLKEGRPVAPAAASPA